MTPNRDRGIIDTPSSHSVDETVEKLKGILQAKGVTLFALANDEAAHRSELNSEPPTNVHMFSEPVTKSNFFSHSLRRCVGSNAIPFIHRINLSTPSFRRMPIGRHILFVTGPMVLIRDSR